MAMSGGMIEPESSASSELLQIVNLSYWFLPESSVDLTASICAKGGFFSVKSRIKLLMLCASPSKRISTPASPLLRTYPAKPFFARYAVDEWTETDALNNTCNVYFYAQR